MRRGEIWWTDVRPDKVRPVVLVSRNEAYERRQLVVVAPVTTRARGTPSEVPVGRTEGLDRPSVVNCDVLTTISKRMLLRRAGSLSPTKIVELDRALRFALGLE